MYRKFYARKYAAELSDEGRRILSWWANILCSLKPRFPRCFSHRPDFIVYTDAALLLNRIAGIIMTNSHHGPVVTILAEASARKFRGNQFPRRNPIIGMGILGPLALLRTSASRFANKRVNLYIDNGAAADALIRGDFHDPALASTIGAFWKKKNNPLRIFG